MTLPRMYTSGKYIKNKDTDQNTFFRGVAPGYFGEGSSVYWNGGLTQLTLLMNALHALAPGVNVLRCVTHIRDDGGYPTWTDYAAFNTAVDDLLTLAASYDMYVILEFHGGLSASQYTDLIADPSLLSTWHAHFANRYASDPTYLGNELLNEPNSAYISQAQWMTVATASYNAIRAVNTDALILAASVPVHRVHADWQSSPLGNQAVYTWNNYASQFEYDWWHKPYWDGDYDTGWSRWLAYWTTSECHLDTLALPCWGAEFGWTATDHWKLIDHWYELLNLYATHWYTWWWHDNPSNYGLAQSDYASLSYQGAEWVKYLNVPIDYEALDSYADTYGDGALAIKQVFS